MVQAALRALVRRTNKVRRKRKLPKGKELAALLSDDLLKDIADKEKALLVALGLQRELQRLAAHRSNGIVGDASVPQLLKSFDLQGVAQYIKEHDVQRVVVMCGAGISTSAGIPDFRSPGTGLYDNLQQYKLPAPEAIFTLSYFRKRPAAFYRLAKEMWPGRYHPTPCHFFIRLLHEKGMLLRCYSQNIDSLEQLAGLPAEKLVAAHGNFDAAHVIDTEPEKEVDIQEVKEEIERGESGWRSLRERHGGLVKPKIVFFGESLPDRFLSLHADDLQKCDLLIVMGTSLAVGPFNSLVGHAAPSTPRLLINRDPVGLFTELRRGFRFHLKAELNGRDVFYRGSCDAGARDLAAALGWEADLDKLVANKGKVLRHLPKAAWHGVVSKDWRRGITARFARRLGFMSEKALRGRLRPVAASQSRLLRLKCQAARLRFSKQRRSAMPTPMFASDVGKNIMKKSGWVEGESLGKSPHISPLPPIEVSAPPPSPFFLPASAA